MHKMKPWENDTKAIDEQFKSNLTEVRNAKGETFPAIMLAEGNDQIRILKNNYWETLTDLDSLNYAFKVFGNWDRVIQIKV